MDHVDQVRRTFTGTTDRGEHFAILYTDRGVRWLRGADAEDLAGSMRPAPTAPTGSAGAQTDRTGASGIAQTLDSAAGMLGSVAQVVEAMAAVRTWWEARQYRIVEEARFQEERRIPWTADMMIRWVTAHADIDHLDLRISMFLARETAATMAELVRNAKMGVPQSLLYDLELAREVISAGRRLFVELFEELSSSPQYDIRKAIDRQMPGADLNLDFVRVLGDDPADDWSKRLRDKSARGFDDELRDAMRHKDLFLERLLSRTGGTDLESLDKRRGARALLDRVSLVPTAITSLSELMKEGATSRRDDCRELALFTAEVTRTVSLHSAWGVIDSIVRRDTGTGILVTETDGRTALSAGVSGHGLALLTPAPLPALER